MISKEKSLSLLWIFHLNTGMALKQHQELKQSQRLSPLQMQVIKLVELNSVEVEDRIKQELEDNPALEGDSIESPSDANNEDKNSDELITEEDMVLGDYSSEDDVPDYRLNGPRQNNEPSFIEIAYFDDKSLSDLLTEQIGLLKLDARKQIIAEYIIGNLDENGYLERELQAISDDLLFQQHVDVSPLQLEDVLYEIQDLEPAGVGARDLQECLLLQIERMDETQSVRHAKNILTNYFDEFSRKHYDKIIRQMGISEDDLRVAIEVIITLNPKPGNALGDNMETRCITSRPISWWIPTTGGHHPAQ